MTAPVPAADATGAAVGGAHPTTTDVDVERTAVREVRAALPAALGTRLSVGPLIVALRPLLAAGWSRADVVARLEARSWADAGPGLVISVLRDLAVEGPPVPAPAPVPVRRCEEHSTFDASSCPPCLSEIKLGDRRREDLGRALAPLGRSSSPTTHAEAARAHLRDAGFVGSAGRR